MKQLEFWKENEYVRMNRKIDEVKQACQRDMDSMHQKNRNLENQMLMLQQSSKMQENRKPVQGQTSSVQNSEDEQNQVIAELQQKLCNQEVRWTTEMQKIKEEYESEKNQLQTALAQVNSTVSKEKKRVERKVKELELRLEEQQQIVTSQNMQIKKYTANSPKSTIQQEEFAAVAAIAEPKRRMVISESSSFSEGPADSQSMQQKVNELLKNTSLKRDMNLAVQQNLHDKLLHLGIKPAVGGISRTTYESAMAHVLSERQQRQRIYSKYRKMHKDLSQKLDRRVKDRSTRPVVKPKQSGQVDFNGALQTLPQSRPRSSSLPTRQQYTPQPAHQNNTATHSTTSTQMAHHKTRQFGLVEDSSGEEEFDKNFPHAQKATMKCHSPGVQQHTATPALASFQKAAQSSESHQTPVFSISKMKVTMSENESYVKALSNSLQQQLADQSHATKTARVGIPDKLAGITNTNDAVWEIKNTGFEDDNDDDWDISSLEDVPAEHSSVRKSTDKSIDTSTSLWGTFTEPRQGPGLKDTGTGSTLKSSIVTVSDWDDSDGAKI
ncbi:hypothetical protein QTP86_004413 [Hemibagrus guttatus]|nr:hypothetical protein QTP86_004413 [Hemibagrus guttatus]